MLGQNAVQEIENVPVSNSTVKRRTDDMSHDATQVSSNQLDESRDFANKFM